MPTEDAQLARTPDTRRESDPESELVRVDYNEYMMKQILNLPFTESQVVLLRYYHNMKLTEIADMLELSLSTVKRSLNSGIQRLKSPLRP